MRPAHHRQKTTLRNSFLELPLFLLIFGVACASMLVPALHGFAVNDHGTSQAFLYAGVLGLVAFSLIAIAHAGRAPRHGPLGPLMSLLSAFVFLPVVVMALTISK